MHPSSTGPRYPHTEIHISEKDPLLPLDSQPDQQPIDCKTKTKLWLKEHVPRAFLYGFIIYFVFGLMQSPYMKDDHSRDDASINTFQLESADDVLAYNHNQLANSVPADKFSICHEDPTIPYTGLSEFHFDPDVFYRLSIKQETRTKKGAHILVNGGKTQVIVDEEATDVSVKFDVQIDDDDLQDAFWIEQTEDEDQGIYTLIIRADRLYPRRGCIKIHTTVRTPNAAALKSLKIGLANSGVSLGKGLTFEELAISVANGYAEFNDGITTGKTAFSIANGHVQGTIDTLNSDLTSSIANGHNEIVVKKITQENNEAIRINMAIANGHNAIELPTSFDSRFSLKSVIGKRTVDSSQPEKIHRQRGGYGVTAGYYGDDKDTTNSVQLKTSMGSNTITYQ